ncbi:polyprenyl synthetase family protein [Cytobacillus sp. Hz8]|uniref:polyprenyl synthetase family protein n=1 Tax=Cytobacillus sp. Hz8 TaxID=3347168 RepID=UPI0035D8F8E1
MNETKKNKADSWYWKAEKKASNYFKLLQKQALEKTYVTKLTKDIQSWRKFHIHPPFISLFSSKKGYSDYQDYIRWLDSKGKLDQYLDRSISYIYMRDLGKALHSKETQERIQSIVDALKSHLLNNQVNSNETFNLARLYRFTEREGIESTLIWVMNKLRKVTTHFPKEMDALHAERKLIKIIAGVFMHQWEEMDNHISPQERTKKLDRAIRLGYSYGLTYPFIDDLLDAKILTSKEESQYTEMIRTTLISGTVPNLGVWTGKNKEFIQFIHAELRQAFEYIKSQQPKEAQEQFFEQAYVFFRSQEMDRNKDLSNANYTNEELYVPIILKSSFSRLIARSVISAPEDVGFDERTFYYGIYNQLADDFTDIFEDLEKGAVTPYTYYLKYHKRRNDLVNPFELYWTVISYLIHDVYHSDTKTREVILDRAINSQKRFKEKWGTKKYKEIMEIFTTNNLKFQGQLQRIVQKAKDVDFFDKLLRDLIIDSLNIEQKEQENFQNTIKHVRTQINKNLLIKKMNSDSLINDKIIDAANYTLEGDGKRLRPILTWVMGVHGFGLKGTDIMPLLQSLEYMHTASLIFDDLPSQDNASIRRGRPTLHKVYNNAIAELTGLFLIQKAIIEQTNLKTFDAKTILQLIQYSAQMTAEMCRGQAMDLDAKGKSLSLEQLKVMSYYKTGKAFEASLIVPAILAHAEESEMKAIKKYAQHAGIAFQIKDDLLDVEGVQKTLGKPIGKDAENDNSTFVSVLGMEGARKAMWEEYCLAIEALQEVSRNLSFFKQFLNYIVHRDH